MSYLKKLKSKFYFDSTALILIQNYLLGRVRAVCIHGVPPDFLPLEDQFLDLYCIDNLLDSVKHGPIHLFARDAHSINPV